MSFSLILLNPKLLEPLAVDLDTEISLRICCCGYRERFSSTAYLLLSIGLKGRSAEMMMRDLSKHVEF